MTSPISTTIRRSRRRSGGWPPTRFQADRPIGHVAFGRGAGLGYARAAVGGLGQSLRADAGQGFRRASRHACRRARPGVCCSRWTGRTRRARRSRSSSERHSGGQMVLGLVAEVGIPARPEGPAVACRVRMSASEALVQVTSSDATARNWVPFGKFTLPVVQDQGKLDVGAIRRCVGRGHAQSPGAGAVEQGRQGQGEDALPASHRQCVAPGPERTGGSRGRRANRTRRPRCCRASASRRAGA